MKYYQATVTTTSEFADTLSVLLIELGSEGVTVNDYEDVKKVLSEHKWDYADGSLFVGGEDVFVSGYYPENTDFSDLHEKLNALRSMKVINAGTLELELNPTWKNEAGRGLRCGGSCYSLRSKKD